MTDAAQYRVAVYFDFDNVVISRYDQLHGKGSWYRDNAYAANSDDVQAKLEAARVDLSALLDYASSFGSIALSRAYADWSVPANVRYRTQLVERAIGLVQMFPTSGTKNGADIRLSVDAMEDLFRLQDVTHVVIVAGDSDYISLVQSCRRLGRYVVGVGVAGATSKALSAVCDEFVDYDAVVADIAVPDDVAAAEEPAETQSPAKQQDSEDVGRRAATALLLRAIGLSPKDADGWANASSVKNQMKRLNPQFDERRIGHATFMEFIASRGGQVEARADGTQRFVRLR